jgi:hypothetical protein
MPSHRIHETPADGGARVVYLVLSHTNPEQVRRLVRTILSGSPTAHVLIHHDEFVSRLGPDAFADEPRVNVLRPDRRVEWGDYSQVAAVLRAMRWALAHLEFDWLCFISGQDYPLQPLSETEHELAETECDVFMELPDRVEAHEGDWLSPEGEAVRRYFYRYWRVPHCVARLFSPRVRHAAQQLIYRLQRRQPFILLHPMPDGARLGVRRRRPPFSSGSPCLRGSEAGTYSRNCVEVIDGFLRRNPRYVAYFKNTVIPSESFLPTIVWNMPNLRVHPDHRRFIRWDASSADPEPRSHPDVFRAQDLPSLLEASAHFGRKFDARVDGRILDLLDERLEAGAARRRPAQKSQAS